MNAAVVTLWQRLSERRSRARDTIFLRVPRKGLWRGTSWEDACTEAERLAAVLQARGVKRGDRVPLQMEGREGYIAALAVLRLGATLDLLHAGMADGLEIAEVRETATRLTADAAMLNSAGPAADEPVVIFPDPDREKSRSYRELDEAALAFAGMLGPGGNCLLMLPLSTTFGFLAGFYGPLVAPITLCLPDAHIPFAESLIDAEPDILIASVRDLERLWRRIELTRRESTAFSRWLSGLVFRRKSHAPWTLVLARNIRRQFGLVHCRAIVAAEGTLSRVAADAFACLGIPVVNAGGQKEDAAPRLSWNDPRGQAVDVATAERELRAIYLVAAAEITPLQAGLDVQLVLDTEAALFLARRHGLPFGGREELLTEPAFQALVASELRSACQSPALDHVAELRLAFEDAGS